MVELALACDNSVVCLQELLSLEVEIPRGRQMLPPNLCWDLRWKKWKWNVMICRMTCARARGFVRSHYQSYLLRKRYSSLDRFSWYPISALGSLQRRHGYYCLVGLYSWTLAHVIFAQSTDQMNDRAWKKCPCDAVVSAFAPWRFQGSSTIACHPKGEIFIGFASSNPSFQELSWNAMPLGDE